MRFLMPTQNSKFGYVAIELCDRHFFCVGENKLKLSLNK